MEKLLAFLTIAFALALVATIIVCNDIVIKAHIQNAAKEEVIRTLEEQVIKLQHQLFEQQQHESPETGTNSDA